MQNSPISGMKTVVTNFMLALFILFVQNTKAHSAANPDSLNPGSNQPLMLVKFDAIVGTGKISLNWTITDHRKFNHFVIQKSTDGRNFKDLVTMMTDATNFSTMINYNYHDSVKGTSQKVLYYRLQLIDATSRIEYSPIRMVRLDAANEIKIQTFPNPAASELRVIIPAKWQENTVTFEIYNYKGVLVSKVQNTYAAQIQQLNIKDIGPGNYIIRVTNGQESLTSKFSKQ